MVVLCDTSVLVPGFFQGHVHHGATIPLIRRIVAGNIKARVSLHSLAEFYAVSTKIPNLPPATTEQARVMVRNYILKYFKSVSLDEEDYVWSIDRVSEKGFAGGALYDALIFRSALKSKTSALVTWNLKHFERFQESRFKMEIVTPDAI